MKIHPDGGGRAPAVRPGPRVPAPPRIEILAPDDGPARPAGPRPTIEPMGGAPADSWPAWTDLEVWCCPLATGEGVSDA